MITGGKQFGCCLSQSWTTRVASWSAVHIGVPHARSISPLTGTNWQGTGVIPDTPVPADEAYRVAYAKALRHVAERGDVPPNIADEARDVLPTLGG